MIDLRASLGAPPIVFPGLPMRHADVPAAPPSNAPLTTPGQTAQRALGCLNCLPAGSQGLPSGVSLSGPGIGDLQTWFDKIPLWVKIGVGVLGFVGVSYGVYRLVR